MPMLMRGLQTNEREIKYMEVCRSSQNNSTNLLAGNYSFEYSEQLAYLGSQTNQSNNISEEIKSRIIQGNSRYDSYKKC